MNSKIVENFWGLFQDQYQISPSEVMVGYEIPLSVRIVEKVDEMCDLVADWGKFGGGQVSGIVGPARRYWHAEGDKVFVRIQHSPWSERSSIYEFPLDFVEKVVALGCMPPSSEKPDEGGT